MLVVADQQAILICGPRARTTGRLVKSGAPEPVDLAGKSIHMNDEYANR
jgi:hypothetical protein